jgi:hypothetical protein
VGCGGTQVLEHNKSYFISKGEWSTKIPRVGGSYFVELVAERAQWLRYWNSNSWRLEVKVLEPRTRRDLG